MLLCSRHTPCAVRIATARGACLLLWARRPASRVHGSQKTYQRLACGWPRGTAAASRCLYGLRLGIVSGSRVFPSESAVRRGDDPRYGSTSPVSSPIAITRRGRVHRPRCELRRSVHGARSSSRAAFLLSRFARADRRDHRHDSYRSVSSQPATQPGLTDC